jgi:hypothetical protein
MSSQLTTYLYFQLEILKDSSAFEHVLQYNETNVLEQNAWDRRILGNIWI